MIAWLVVFLAVAALDLVFARYTQSVMMDNKLKAGTLASACCLLQATAVIGYAHDPWLLIPAMAGAFIGTIIGMRRFTDLASTRESACHLSE